MVSSHDFCWTAQESKTLSAERVTETSTYFVDIKSEPLRDLLRTVLVDVDGVSMSEDKPAVCLMVLAMVLRICETMLTA